MKFVEINFQLRLGLWSVQLGNEYDRARIMLWRHRGSSAHVFWQWDFRSWPKVNHEPAVSIELVGMRMVPVQMVAEEDDSILDAKEVL